VLKAGARAGIEVSVCGEMASDPVSAFILLGLGYRVLSVAAPNLPLLRWLVRRVAASDARACAAGLLAARETADITAQARAAVARVVDLKLVDPNA
jgi:signal transduction protein with GAF and PtsI domain